jgi:two-component system, NtrC family, response regulator HydG
MANYLVTCDNTGMTAHFLSELISFLDGLPEPRIVMAADYRIVAANAAYIREFGGTKPLSPIILRCPAIRPGNLAR